MDAIYTDFSMQSNNVSAHYLLNLQFYQIEFPKYVKTNLTAIYINIK